MATILRFVEDDLSTVRLSLNALDGGSTGFGVLSGADFGDIDIELELMQSGAAGGSLAFQHEEIVTATFMLEAKHTTFADLRTLFRNLTQELRRENIIEWRADGDATSFFFRTLPSPIPAILRGDDFSNLAILGQFHSVEFPVVIRRQPFLFAASSTPTLTPSSGWTNEVGNREVKLTNPGSVPSPCRITATFPEAGADVVQLRIGRRSGVSARLLAFASNYSFEVEGGTLSGSTSSTADANASGGNMARTSYSATGYFLKRWKKVITPTDVDDLVGTYRVYCALKMTVGSEQTLQLRWGMNNVDPVDFVNEEVTLDGTELSSSIYVPVDLGTVRFEDTATSLVLEGWSRLDTDPGSSTLDWDTITLIPADEQFTTISVPGFRGGAPAREKWTGDQLTTPSSPASLLDGDVHETTLHLDEPDKAGGTKPNAGTVLPAGKHIVTVLATIKDNSGDKTEIAELRVRNVTDGTDAASKNLYSQKNRRETDIEKSVTFDADGSDAYQFQVIATANATVSSKIIVREIRHSFVRTVGNGTKMVLSSIDPEETGIYSGTTRIAPLQVSGPAIELEPGDNTLVFDIGDWSGLHYQDDVDLREPLPKSVAARQVTLAVEVEARHAPL